MPRGKKHGPEEVISKLREAEVLISQGSTQELVSIYRQEMPSFGWQEVEQAARLSEDSAQLNFTGTSGEVIVNAKKNAQGTELAIVLRDVEQAQKDHLVPAAGKGKLTLGNAFDLLCRKLAYAS